MSVWDDGTKHLYSETRPIHLRPPTPPPLDEIPASAILGHYKNINRTYGHLVDIRAICLELDASRERFVQSIRELGGDWSSVAGAADEADWSPRELTEHLAYSETGLLWLATTVTNIEAPYLLNYTPTFETRNDGIEGIIAIGDTCRPIYEQFSDLDLRKPVESPFSMGFEQTVWGAITRNITHADEHAATMNQIST